MTKKPTAALLCFLFLAQHSIAQNGYSNYSRQSARLNAMAKEHPHVATLRSIGKTPGNKDVWMMTLGSGDTGAKPAIAIVGGVEGTHLLGTELSIGFAEKLLENIQTDSIKTLLAKTTFYIFPNMSPDAMEQYWAALKYERQGNGSQTDDDRDGRMNEDGYDDLDGNGKITMMRIESPIGDYRINPEDARGLVKADLTKGEKGTYLLLTEGTDNDKDGSFNEDGEGGVWFNKNFTYKHPSFTQGAGEFAVSEPETRALLDQLYQLFNVYAVVSFSSNNNLSAPYTYNPANASQRIVAGYLEPDAKVNAMVSDLYNKTANMKDAPKTNAAGGDFLSWAYFHYGRFSFSTPGWYVPKPKTDTAKKEKPFVISDSVVAYLRWADGQNITGNFTPWKKIQHPDFPGQNVEVGGIDPFVLINPPYALVADLTARHTDFLTKLAALQPQVDITNVRTEKLGNGLTRITASVTNTGALPSHAKLGERTYWVKRINVKLTTGNGQSLLSGKKIQVLNSLEGYSAKELTWLVRGSGKVVLEAGSPTTGTKKTEIGL
jgi:hypothetical protein